MFETKRSSLKKLFKEIDNFYSDKQIAINEKRMLLNHLENIEGSESKLFNELSLKLNKEEEEYQIEAGIRPDFRSKK